MEVGIQQNLKTYIRIRPLLSFESEQVVSWSYESNSVQDQGEIRYEYDGVYGMDSRNEQIYQECVQPVIQKCFEGYNGSIIAYGQTASGKTHTIFGEQGVQKGIVLIGLEYIFNEIQRKSEQMNYLVSIQYIEIYNECVYDLISSSDIELRVINQGGLFLVEGSRNEIVQNENEAYQLLIKGNSKKKLGDSYLHNRSSRSHTIFKVIIGSEDKVSKDKNISELNFVDLAGSETLCDQYGYQQQTESKHINLSLFCLKSVIVSLSQKDKFIPYRNSVLTKLLQNSLGGNSLSCVICTISPSQDNKQNSKRTLQFAQIASTVQNIVQRNIVIYQQNKDIKMKSNVYIEEVKIQEKQQQQQYKQRVIRRNQSKDEVEQIIIEQSGTLIHNAKIYRLGDQQNKKVFILHAYGYRCTGNDCMGYIWKSLVDMGYCVISPDFPGFGETPGERYSSRTEYHLDKGGSVEFMEQIMRYYGINKQNQAIVIGYDWGASIAMAYCTQNNELISKLICFHPSWTSEYQILSKIKIETLLLWVPVEQLHPISQGDKINKIIPKCKLIKLNIGKFNSDKASNYYASIGEQVLQKIQDFLPKPKIQQNQLEKEQINILKQQNDIDKQQQEDNDEEEAGEVIEEEEQKEDDNISNNVILKEMSLFEMMKCMNPVQQQQQQQRQQQIRTNIYIKQQQIQKVSDEPPSNGQQIDMQQWAVQKFIELLRRKEINEYYKAYLSGSQLKPYAVRLFGNLPLISPGMDPQKFLDYGILEELPRNLELVQNFPEYLVGRQVLIKTRVNSKVTQGVDGIDYLSYNKDSEDIYITHRATIYKEEADNFVVEVDTKQGGVEYIRVQKDQVYEYNGNTNFGGEALKGGLVFEDQVKCKYKDSLTRGKLLEAALSIRNIIKQLDYSRYISIDNSNEGDIIYCNDEQGEQMLSIQQQCVKSIVSVINCIHLVHEGIDINRYTSTDTGKLAYYGQGNCHHLASTTCAFLLPFTRLLGISVKFRAGFCISRNRDIDPFTLEPLSTWDHKPRRVQDHTWAEVTYYPSLRTKVVDTSFNWFNVPIDIVYSRFIGHHVSEQQLQSSNKIQTPICVNRKGERVKKLQRIFAKREQNKWQVISEQNNPPDWSKIL